MRKIYLPIILLASILFCACSQSDDIVDIFMNRTWKLSLIREGNKNIDPKGIYSLQFFDGAFTATTPKGATISGKWQADGSNRMFRCTQVSVSNGDISNDSIAKKMKNIFEKSESYNGDINYLQIKQQNNVYMQFHNR